LSDKELQNLQILHPMIFPIGLLLLLVKNKEERNGYNKEERFSRVTRLSEVPLTQLKRPKGVSDTRYSVIGTKGKWRYAECEGDGDIKASAPKIAQR